jgi:hypothetical protein
MKTNGFVWVGILIAIVIAIGGYFFPQVQQAFGGTGTRFPNGLSADSTSPSAGQVRGTSLTITGNSSISGLLAVSSSFLTFSPTAVSTTTTGGNAATLSQADLLAGEYYTVNINQASDFTYTLPASSTLTTLLPSTGNQATWCFDNATSTGNIDLVFVAGTGIDLQMATSSSVLEYVQQTSMGCITLVRKSNTDLFGLLQIYNDSD